jgi:hypothetical protein
VYSGLGFEYRDNEDRTTKQEEQEEQEETPNTRNTRNTRKPKCTEHTNPSAIQNPKSKIQNEIELCFAWWYFVGIMKNQIILTLVAILFIGVLSVAAQHDETPKGVEGGGVFVKGWSGTIDAKEQAAGLTVNSAKLVSEGKGMRVTTGPAVTYWNPANTAKGDYTVSATFNEPKYMSINDHPHPYGIVIGGNDMGTENATYLYCAAYGNGNYIVRGFRTKAVSAKRQTHR